MEYALIGLIVVVIYAISLYNGLVALKEAVIASEKEISVQLDRRGKVFDSLMAVVKKYMSHENDIFVKIAELRNQSKTGNTKEINKEAETELSKIVNSGALTSSLNFTMEAYPELQSSSNVLQLQEEIISTENKLSFAKKAFNNSIEDFNISKESFPDILIVKMFSHLNKNFTYWELEKEAIKNEEEKRISFE